MRLDMLTVIGVKFGTAALVQDCTVTVQGRLIICFSLSKVYCLVGVLMENVATKQLYQDISQRT